MRAEHLRKAHFKRLALKSAQARRKASEARALAAEVEAETGERVNLGETLGGAA